ncbi:hypothetical protein [Thermoflavimicrobium dichotomicum]|uniref:Peptidase_C39 like family protein n=1 Tax=Thermoflavimicrobium dichotomicum TaxID=46223 RepID=A0A1I3U407_9BACL|nr:hypothetical protein [Thermoflavimicrobium dichotomicum]SFJ78288.1 hypothetical protein SAMN05421852_12212 [Thermoflavimicrobium dichotomicum]
MKRFILSVSFCVLAAIIAFSPSSLVFAETKATQGQVQNQLQVSEKDAIKAVKNFLKHSNEWDNQQLKVLANLYDIEGNLTAYYIVAEKDGKEAGYFISSSTRDKSPVIQGGLGKSPLTQKVKKEISAGNKVYFLGVSALVGYKNENELRKGLELKRQELVTKLKKKKKFKDAEKMAKAQLKKPETSPENNRKWDFLLSDASFQTQSVIVNYIDMNKFVFLNQNLVSFNPETACGPTAGAMMAEYYENLGLGVRGINYYGKATNLVTHLEEEMNTGVTGTWLDDFRDGLDQHFQHNGQSWSTYSLDAEGNYAKVRQWIDGNAPLAIMHQIPFVEWHWQVIVGYRLIDGYPWLSVADPATGSGAWVDYYEVDGYSSLVYTIK